ncbi:MAG: ABC transporter permease [Chloroflexi bacterium]|nr:ABC transporter permease [Chloroflexota bacterium]
MLIRIIGETFARRKKRVVLALLAVSLGASLTSALFTVYGDFGQRMSDELRSYGANLLLRPASANLEMEVAGITYTPPGARALIDERELPNIKDIFWSNNITGIAPSLSAVVTGGGQPVLLTGTWFEKQLSAPGNLPKQFASKSTGSGEESTFVAGIKNASPWWQVSGDWVRGDEMEGAMVGSAVAQRLGLLLGDRFTLNYQGKELPLRTAGVVSTGGLEDYQVYVNLPVVQELLGIDHGVDQVLVSARVTPKDKVSSSIRGKDPSEMTPQEYETWYCTPLVESIAYQIDEVVPTGKAAPIRQVSEAESSFVGKTELLVLLITVLALVTSALGVMANMMTMVMERRKEIGLMKAIGAQNSQIATIFLIEAAIIGVLGGLIGLVAGLGLAQLIARQVFNVSFVFSLVALPLIIVLSTLIALAGSALPIRQGIKVEPARLLKDV